MDSTTQPNQLGLSETPTPAPQNLVAAASEVLEIESVRHLRVDTSPTGRLSPSLEIKGRLLMASERAYDLIAERFRVLGHTALLRKDGQADVILAVSGTLPISRGLPWPAVGFFIATLLSVLYVGGAKDLFSLAGYSLENGLFFASGLLSILLAHEFGHYVATRLLGVPASLPYFIPLPLPPFGTMGAVIRMKAPPINRRKLFVVAISGPLAGLVVAIPVLVMGLSLSPVLPLPETGYMQEGNSLLYAGIKLLLFGRVLPSAGYDVTLHPLAFAGWAGLFVTGMNLIPAGQLDGGHIAYALFGDKARVITYGVIVAMLGLSLLWTGWLLWAGLAFILLRVPAVLLDEVTPLRPRERILAIVAILIFVGIFIPIPLELH